MPLRSDPSLWFNLPGVVAAYQPVRAPDSLSARYNMAHGGDNRYRAAPGVLPAWSGVAGWTFDGVAQYLNTMGATSGAWSYLVRVSGMQTNGVVFGVEYNQRISFAHEWNFNYFYNCAASFEQAGYVSSGVFAMSDRRCFLNGVLLTTLAAAGGDPWAYPIAIGALRAWDTIMSFFAGSIQCMLIVRRALSDAEVWQASRQMQYCDVNPDWSVWSPRRKWYPFVLEAPAAGRVGIYGARPTIALPGGVRIVPQSEGGING